jgi:hypothetical protein
MGILDDMKSMIEPKATEKVGYQRTPKDGRSSTGFKKPEEKPMRTGNKNMNKMLEESKRDERGGK